MEIDNTTGYIFDVAIVKDDVVNKTYSNKMSKYQQLAQKLYEEKGLKKTYIIPVILSINGLISKHTIRRLIELEFNIKLPPIQGTLNHRNEIYYVLFKPK